jgi:hypothetical protein
MEKVDKIGRPIKVKVAALDYKIIWRTDDWGSTSDCYGLCETVARRITLDATQDDMQAAVTFLHEVLHAIHSIQLKGQELDAETFANMTSVNLVAFWRDNPKTFAWWNGIINGK